MCRPGGPPGQVWEALVWTFQEQPASCGHRTHTYIYIVYIVSQLAVAGR